MRDKVQADTDGLEHASHGRIQGVQGDTQDAQNVHGARLGGQLDCTQKCGKW